MDIQNLLRKIIRRRLAKYYQHRVVKRQKMAARYAFGKILDVGCTQNFNRFLTGDVTGLDVIRPKELPGNYKAFILGDAKDIKHLVQNKFNTITALELIEHLPNYVQFLKDCYEILEDEGVLILSAPNPFLLSSLLSNIIWGKGLSGAAEIDGKILQEPYYGHINIIFPRTLNRINLEIGLKPLQLNYISSGIGFPLTAGNIFYVYKK